MAENKIYEEIKRERARQDKKWGVQNHGIYKWLAILGEEVGEANCAALEAEWLDELADKFRKEMIQVAAVSVAILEALDRNMPNQS